MGEAASEVPHYHPFLLDSRVNILFCLIVFFNFVFLYLTKYRREGLSRSPMEDCSFPGYFIPFLVSGIPHPVWGIFNFVFLCFN